MSAIETAAKILDEAREQIQANMARHYRTSKGERWINASGRSSAAFKVVADGANKVMLVYRGSDVAPLETLQYGTTNVPTIEEAERWRKEKEASGAKGLPSAEGIVKAIAQRGTERHQEPQDWVIGPVVEAAVAALNEQLPSLVVKDIHNKLF